MTDGSSTPSASDDVVLGTVAGPPPGAPETTGIVPPQIPPVLPATGSNVGPALGIAGCFLAWGLALVVFVKLRRRIARIGSQR